MIRMVGKPGRLSETWKAKIIALDQEHFHFLISNITHAHWWWAAFQDKEVAGFAGAKDESNGLLFLGPCGVLPDYRGRGIQNDFIRVRVRHARRMGFQACVTGVESGNIASANNLIDEGFRLTYPWREGEFMRNVHLFRKEVGVDGVAASHIDDGGAHRQNVA